MIRLARELRGLTQTAVARASKIPQARLSRIESGHLEPSSAELGALARSVQMCEEFFLEPGVPAAVPLFRKRAIRSARKLTMIQARLNTAVLVAQRLLASGIEIDPPQTFPEPGEYDPNDPAGAAAALRRDWRLPAGRVDDVTALIEGAGGIVLRIDFGTEEATAAFLSTRGDSRLWFLVNTRETAGDRIRLSLAHELGHAVLHRLLPLVSEYETELQAFTFATALLLPPEYFDHVIPFDSLTLTDARQLKRTFGVSLQAIIRTAHLRGRIGRERYTSLYKQLSARQWRAVEPEPVRMEMPHIWPDVLRVHREAHAFSDEDLANIARVPQEVVADLFSESFSFRPPLRLVPRVKPVHNTL
jgi:Zn-dependent peptidase ImmA (M78 family)